ncbi:glycoside hydrolase family 10 protein [Hoylesella loescheii]|uniref:glycoside hydrolase family 10 protein n=1 Tax=Hoylesella loescheii TaxID=840 RepID=UPI00248D7672|nr:family 10 glycosylhydrolase [Hoylesella loescheii]
MVKQLSFSNRFLLLFFALSTATMLCAKSFSFFKPNGLNGWKMPKREVRAVWLTTIGGLDWPHSYAQNELMAGRQKQELRDILDKLQRAGINTVLFQARVRGTVVYPSQLEPWDGCLSGVPGRSPGYDPLDFAIDECHKRGMELHAWVVTIPVGKWNALGCKTLRNKYPHLIKRIGEEGYMDPENTATATYLANFCKEITDRYDVDGIHLDYIRYPETWKINIAHDAARRNITTIVRAIGEKVKASKPWVKYSCSPIGKFSDLSRFASNGWNAYAKVCQDAQGWLRDGLMDALFPMMYFQGNHFFPFAIDWAEQSYGRMLVPGLGIYFMSSSEKNWSLDVITREMQVARQYGMGHAYFRSKFFTDNLKGIYTYAQRVFTPTLALPPAMTWENNKLPAPPSELNTSEEQGKAIISWRGGRSANNSPYILYNVYASTSYPVDVTDARNLIAMRYAKNRIVVSPRNAQMYFAVTSIDRYGNESLPLQTGKAAGGVKSELKMLAYSDGKVSLPKSADATWGRVWVVETLQGQHVTTLSSMADKLDVRSINDGVYVLRALNSKGVGHRLGMFTKKARKL